SLSRKGRQIMSTRRRGWLILLLGWLLWLTVATHGADPTVDVAKPTMKSIPVDLKPAHITLDLDNVSAPAIFDEIQSQSLNPIEIAPSPYPTGGFPEPLYSIHLKDERFWPAMTQACLATHYHVLGVSFFPDHEPQVRANPA